MALAWAGIAALALARLLFLGADPPAGALSDFITDEGWYSLNARNRALFGRWVTDQHNVALVLCPLHTLALRLAYAVFGVGLASTRAAGAIASVLTVGIVAWRLRRWRLAGALGAALVAAAPVLFGMSRVAFGESLQLLGIAAWWAAASAAAERADPCEARAPVAHTPRSVAALWVASGAAAAAAFFVKASVPWVPVLALVAPFLFLPVRRGVRSALAVAAGLALVTVPCALFVLQFLPLLLAESAREGSVLWLGQGRPAGVLLPFLLGLLPPNGDLRPAFWVDVLPFAAAGAIAGARLLVTPARRTSPAVRLAGAWLAASFGFLALRKIAALEERYWMNVAVPVAILVAAACLAPGRDSPREGWRRLLAASLVAYPVALAARPLLLPLVRTYAPAVLAEHFHRAFALPVVLAWALLAAVAARLRVPDRCAGSRFPAVPLAALLLALSAAVSLAPLVRPSFTVRDAARAVAADGVPKVLVGDVANTIALETPYWAFVSRDLARMNLGVGWINADWRAMGATHWVAAMPPGQPWTEQCPPGSRLVWSRPIWPGPGGDPRLVLHLCDLAGALPGVRLRSTLPSFPTHEFTTGATP